MIHLGIDALDIHRCSDWSTYQKDRLRRLFSENEIQYCLTNKAKAAERFAVRFAAKEALFKALAPIKRLPLLRLYRYSQVIFTPHPSMEVNWAALGIEPWQVQLSLTHTETTAIAAILLISKKII